jgi:nicotinate dehydrogenase subunit A
MAVDYTLEVNGRGRTVRVDDPEMPLLYVLRDTLELDGTKFGCGLAQCGACTVVLNGRAVRSCRTPIEEADGQSVLTLEGLGTPQNPHPIQQAFIDEQAAQCGYCVPGIIMSAKALLDDNPRPTDAEIKQALAGNLCRCGTHQRIVRAVSRAAQTMAQGG